VIAALTMMVVAERRATLQTGQGAAGQMTASQWLERALGEYTGGRHRSAEAACDNVILSLQSGPSLDAVQSNMLLKAYELRSRVRYAQRNPRLAREDFRTILSKWPAHTYGSVTMADVGVVNPEALSEFEAVKKEVVGVIVLNVTPADAEVTMDGAVVAPEARAAGQQIPVMAGQHTVLAQRSGHDKREESITVPAGETVTVAWTLERLTSRIEVLTSPPGVEVYLDGVLRGKTPAGQPPRKYTTAEDVRALGSEASGVLEVGDVRKGSHRWEFKLDCYLPVEERTNYDPPGDFYIAKKLIEASSVLRIEGSGGRVFIDGVQKGTVPYTEKLCPRPQPQRVEIRTDRGRQVQTVTAIAGRPITIQTNTKPAIAVLSQVGLPPAFREDLRRELETALAPAERLTFFAPNPEMVQKELAANSLEPGWLSFDLTGRPMSNAAQLSKERRLNISNALSRSLEVQGVAEISIPEPREPRTVVLTFLAAGSSTPEMMQIKLEDPQGSVRDALRTLNSVYPTSRISSGVEVADVAGVTGAVVLRQVWDLTNGIALNPGDVIESVDGRKMEDGTAFEHAIALRKAGDKVQLQVRGTGGQSKTVPLAPATFSLVVSYYDETLPINRLILDFRNRVVDAPTPREESIARLNLAVVLMRAGNWNEARAELDKVDLADLQRGQAVSRGTVQYYLGLCYDALDRRAEADKAYQAAAASPGALLTGDDNTLVKPLAEEKLRTRRSR
jgi:hypothetical protein